MEAELRLLQDQINTLRTLVSAQGELIEEYINFAENNRNQPSTMYPDSKYKKSLKQLKQIHRELGL